MRDRVRWVVRVIHELDRALEHALRARSVDRAPPPRSREDDERELRVCRDTLRAAMDAVEDLSSQLQHEALRYRELVEFVPAGDLAHSASVDGRIFPASRGWSRLESVTKRDRIDWLLTAIQAVEDLVQPKLEARRGKMANDEERARDEDLQICLEELRVAAEELGALRDRLALERQRYVELFDFAPEPYLETDRHGNVREANRAAVALLRCEREYLSGKPFALFVEEGSRKQARSQLNALAGAHADDVVEFETRVSPREADPIPVAVRACPARDTNGRVTGVRWMLRPTPGRPAATECDAPGKSD